MYKSHYLLRDFHPSEPLYTHTLTPAHQGSHCLCFQAPEAPDSLEILLCILVKEWRWTDSISSGILGKIYAKFFLWLAARQEWMTLIYWGADSRKHLIHSHKSASTTETGKQTKTFLQKYFLIFKQTPFLFCLSCLYYLHCNCNEEEILPCTKL